MSTAFLFRQSAGWTRVGYASRLRCHALIRRSTDVKLAAGHAARRARQAGQGLAEYALILALIAVLAIAAITFMGGSINDMLSALGNAM